MMWYGYGDLGWLGWTLSVLSMVAFWGLVFWAVSALVRPGGNAGRNEEPSSPEQVLARRFAAGEIDEEAFQRSREVLAGKRTVDHLS